MAEFKEAMQQIGINSDAVPSLWETYYIAAKNKYANVEGNKSRYQMIWYKQINKWLDLDDYKMEALLKASLKILHNESLYEWSSFIRYLLYDTLIFQEDENILLALQPKRGMEDFEDMFTLISYLSGFDISLKLYKQMKLEDHYLLDVFSIISTLLDEYNYLNDEWGTASQIYLPRLAWGSLHIFDGIAFELAQAKLPGDIYKNERSGEIIMLADADQLYYENGQRISMKLENEIKEKSNIDETVVIEDNVLNDGEGTININLNNLVHEKISQLPDDIWQTVKYKTENNNIVANVISAEGLAEKVPRVLDESYWNKIYSKNEYVINIFIPNLRNVSIDQVSSAAVKAWFYFASENDVNELKENLWSDNNEEIIENFLYKDEVGSSDSEMHKNRGSIYPKLFVHESAMLSANLDDEFAVGSELAYLYDIFRKYPMPEARDNTLISIFSHIALKEPAIMWPEESELQKIVKSRVIEDKLINIAGGFFTPQDLIIIVDRVLDKQNKTKQQSSKEKDSIESIENIADRESDSE